MTKKRDPMKSHFVITIWNYENKSLTEEIDNKNYLDFDPIINKIREVVRMCRGHYFCYSIEDSRLKVVHPPKELQQVEAFSAEAKVGEVFQEKNLDPTDGGLHIHVYMELQRTMRWSTAVNKFQKNGFNGSHVEVRTGWRETCREYHMGIKNYEPKLDHIISGEWGKWREELGDSYSREDFFELAANMIIHGYRPNQVAMRFPAWYIRHGFGIERLYQALSREDW